MNDVGRRHFVSLSGAALAMAAVGAPSIVRAAGNTALKVYKSPFCGCCGAWVDHLRQNGFKVDVTDMDDVTPVKAHFRVDPDLHSCHTAVFDGYVIEGHVPADDILRLIMERPRAIGLAVPGMPIGSPGMEQRDEKEPYDVILFGPNKRQVFASYR